MDTTPPVLTLSALYTVTQPITNTVFGTVQDSSGVPTITLEVTTQPGNITTIYDCGRTDPLVTHWACNWFPGDAPGMTQVIIRAKATDNVGNTTPQWSDPLALAVDSTPPVVALDAALAYQLANNWLNQGYLMLLGTADDDDAVSQVEICLVDRFCVSRPVTPPNSASGQWFYPLTALDSGDGIEQAVTLSGVDASGNQSEPFTVTVRIDTVAPVLTVTQSAVTATVNSQQQLLAGLVTDGGELSQIFGRIVAPDGTTTWAVAQHDGDSWQLWATLTAEGSHMVWLEAWDEAGNVSRYGPFLVTAEVEDLEIGWQVYLPVVIKP